MKKTEQQNSLLNEIKRRLPQNTKLADVFIKTLGISKEAAYRRLRNEVPLTFDETAILAKDFGISLDNLVGVEVQYSRPFQLRLPEFIDVQEEDSYMFDDFLCFLKKISDSPDTEVGMLTNMLPQDLFSGFGYLIKFNVFKWQYYYHNEQVIPFHELYIPRKVLSSFKKQFEHSKNIKKTIYIFDNSIYKKIVDEINYFHNIQLINKEDTLHIREELLRCLDYIEELTESGKFKETENDVLVYITNLEVTTPYTYLRSGDVKYSLIKTFILTSATSLDNKTFDKMKDWIRASMRTSTLITQTNENFRLQYFRTQREIIDTLNQNN